MPKDKGLQFFFEPAAMNALAPSTKALKHSRGISSPSFVTKESAFLSNASSLDSIFSKSSSFNVSPVHSKNIRLVRWKNVIFRKTR